MKKLLLALLILVGSVLPGMAHECEDRYAGTYDNSMADKLYFIVVQRGDYECARYYADILGADAFNNMQIEKDISIFDGLIFSPKQGSVKFFSYLLQNGIEVKESNLQWLTFFLAEYAEGNSENFYNSVVFKKFKLLLDAQKDNIWQKFTDQSVYHCIDGISIKGLQNTSFIELLINSGMPKSEYNRYIKETKNGIYVDYKSVPDVSSYEEILRQNREYEVAKQILSLFEQGKKDQLQEINDNVEKTFHKITEEKMKQYK